MRLLRSQFQLLDKDASGVLSIKEACGQNFATVADPTRRPPKEIDDLVRREEQRRRRYERRRGGAARWNVVEPRTRATADVLMTHGLQWSG